MKKLLILLALSFNSFAATSICHDSWQNNTIPFYKYDQELCFKEFSVLYVDKNKAPIAVAEHLTAQEISDAKSIKRHDAFHAETLIAKQYESTPSDYLHTGYDRGHMAPAGDMPTTDSQYESFSMANMTPQLPELNRKQWRLLEEKVRDLTKTNKDVWVVTGAIFSDKTISKGIAVPSVIYKIVKTSKTQVFVGDNVTGTVSELTPEQFKSKYNIDIN